MTTFFGRVKEPERTKAVVPEVRPENLPKTDTPSPLPLLCPKTAAKQPTGRKPVLSSIKSCGRSGSPLSKAERISDPLNKGIFHPNVPKKPESISSHQKIKPITRQ